MLFPVVQMNFPNSNVCLIGEWSIITYRSYRKEYWGIFIPYLLTAGLFYIKQIKMVIQIDHSLAS